MLRDDINNALKEAMKAKNERAVSTLRMVNSSLKNADIEARGQSKPPLTDAELLGLVRLPGQHFSRRENAHPDPLPEGLAELVVERNLE